MIAGLLAVSLAHGAPPVTVWAADLQISDGNFEPSGIAQRLRHNRAASAGASHKRFRIAVPTACDTSVIVSGQVAWVLEERRIVNAKQSHDTPR